MLAVENGLDKPLIRESFKVSVTQEPFSKVPESQVLEPVFSLPSEVIDAQVQKESVEEEIREEMREEHKSVLEEPVQEILHEEPVQEKPVQEILHEEPVQEKPVQYSPAQSQMSLGETAEMDNDNKRNGTDCRPIYQSEDIQLEETLDKVDNSRSEHHKVPLEMKKEENEKMGNGRETEDSHLEFSKVGLDPSPNFNEAKREDLLPGSDAWMDASRLASARQDILNGLSGAEGINHSLLQNGQLKTVNKSSNDPESFADISTSAPVPKPGMQWAQNWFKSEKLTSPTKNAVSQTYSGYAEQQFIDRRRSLDSIQPVQFATQEDFDNNVTSGPQSQPLMPEQIYIPMAQDFTAQISEQLHTVINNSEQNTPPLPTEDFQNVQYAEPISESFPASLNTNNPQEEIKSPSPVPETNTESPENIEKSMWQCPGCDLIIFLGSVCDQCGTSRPNEDETQLPSTSVKDTQVDNSSAPHKEQLLSELMYSSRPSQRDEVRRSSAPSNTKAFPTSWDLPPTSPNRGRRTMSSEGPFPNHHSEGKGTEQRGSWECKNCGRENISKFFSCKCGSHRPDQHERYPQERHQQERYPQERHQQERYGSSSTRSFPLYQQSSTFGRNHLQGFESNVPNVPNVPVLFPQRNNFKPNYEFRPRDSYHLQNVYRTLALYGRQIDELDTYVQHLRRQWQVTVASINNDIESYQMEYNS